MKLEICKAFCSDLSVREIENGFAISTPYDDVYGDPIGFYALATDADTFKLIDHGATVAFIEAAGATLDSGTRQEVFHSLLDEYGANYDDDRGELTLPFVTAADLPKACLRFMALLLRLSDLLLLTRERVENTFREDVVAELKQRLSGLATVNENSPIEQIPDVVPDLVMRAPNRDPVALFIATSDQKVNEAIYLQMAASHEAKVPISVVALLETEGSVKGPLRQRADNRLDAVPRYRKDERGAIDRVVKQVIGRTGDVRVH